MTPASDTAPGGDTQGDLIRLLASTAAVRAGEIERMRELALRAGLGPLWRTLYDQSLLPLLGARVEELLGDQTPAEFRRRVGDARSHCTRVGAMLEALTVGMVERLEAAGVPALPIKGAILGARMYGDSGLRQQGDIDILVSGENLAAATAVLRAAGYDEPRDPVWVDGKPLLHLTFKSRDGRRPPIEVHWRIHWGEHRFSEALLRRSHRDERFGRVADPADELAALLLFYARDSFYGLRLAADVAGFWDRFGGDLEDLALEPIIEAHPEIAPSLVASVRVVGQLVGLPADRLADPSRRLRRQAGLATGMANWRATGTRGQVEAETALVDLLLSAPGTRREWLRRSLVQPLDHIALERGLSGRSRPELIARSVVHGVVEAARFAPHFAGALSRSAAAPA